MKKPSHTVHVAEATGFTLLCVMKTSRPIDSDVTFLTIQSRGTLHAATGANTAKLEQAVEDGAIITDVVLALLAHVAVHIVRGDLLKEIDVVVRVELCHFAPGRRLGTLLKSVRQPSTPHCAFHAKNTESHHSHKSPYSCTDRIA